MCSKSLAFFLAFIIAASVRAEYKTNVHSFSRRDGLSNGAVNTIIKDAGGYIWFGTWNGLNRFDGSNFVTYLPGNDANSIHNHVIRELYPTASGAIWMLTNKGIGLYDNVHDRFTSYFTHESDQVNYETDIAVSHSDSYGTMASVYGQGLFKYDNNTRQFSRITVDKASKALALNIKRIHLVENLVYCISGNGQLLTLTGSHLRVILQLPVTGILSSSLAVVINLRPYILISQRSGPALMVDLFTREVQQLRIDDDLITSFSKSKTEERLWVGTEKGKIYSFNLKTREFEVLKGLSNLFTINPIATRILSIYETDPDILWVGTDGNGVYTLKLSEFPNTSLPSSQLAYPIVRSILITRKRDVLIGTKGGGVDIFDAQGNHIRRLSVKDGLSNNSVLSFHELDDGSICVGTDGKGIDIMSADYRKIRNFPRDFHISNPLDFASVYRILENSDKQLYLGTSGYGVILVELDKNDNSRPISCEQLILDKNNAAPKQQKQIVYAITEEKPGIIWIGTRGLGVFRYNTITKRVITQYSTTSHGDLIRNDDILSLLTGRHGNIWVGSSNGIFKLLTVTDDSVISDGLYTQSDLSGTSIHAIQQDKSGNIWVTTNQGLSLIDHGGEKVRSFNVNDGLINFEYSDGASFFDGLSGKLYVGGTMGVDIIQSDKIRLSSYFPPIAINQLLIRNLPVTIGEGSVLSASINIQKSLDLKYNQNSLTFYISPLAFWGQERHRISYRLKNFLDDWTINPLNQPITFSNLSAGKYIFQVRVSDENGNWSKQSRDIVILINPPFWRTTWAILGYIFLFFAIQAMAFGVYRRRVARRKEAALQEFLKQKESELQAYKIEFFTNVAHEFRTPLTLITSHIHSLIEETKNTEFTPRLLKIFNNSIKLQNLVLEIMQFRKLEKGKEPLNIHFTKPVSLIMEVVSDLELLALQKEVTCVLSTSDPELVFATDADKFQRIFTNLISNGIKYNKPGGVVKALITTDQGNLRVEIEDNGIGIQPEFFQKMFEPFGIPLAKSAGNFPNYRSTGLGLAVTKGLISLLKGSIDFESHPGIGTKFTCIFPDVHHPIKGEAQLMSNSDFGEISILNDIMPVKPLESSEKSEGKALVLIVDDDPEILDMLRNFLKSDYNLTFAVNGLEAYDKVLSEKPDLIIADVMMPVMDGIEFCGKLRENFDTSHLPLILLTGRADIEDRISGLKAGADSYIPKPFHPEHLKVRIETLLKRWDGIKLRFHQMEVDPSLEKEITDPFFQKMLSCIDENLDDETFSSDKLCDKLAISKSSLYNKTRLLLGATPHSLINQRRLSKAAILLRSSSMTVSEIIDHTGFASRTYFYDLFNKAYGCSPSDYRNRLMEE
ncbi:MAG: response regulator [Bacteroidetes bacterium]|nr:response regulator [Bacteroidota bacterium]